jgi:hypothetical protein
MNIYFVLFGVDPRPVKEFKESDCQCENEPSNQNVDDTSHITQRELARSGSFPVCPRQHIRLDRATIS